MDALRDLFADLNIRGETFNTLIILLIIFGSLWAIKRLYTDLTRPLDESSKD
jgi:hypothetical protein